MKINKEYFLNYKDTYIFQDKESFCYGLDSILLANFIKVGFNKKIMDLGTGNIPIPLFLYKNHHVKVDCIEIQKNIYDLALKTILYNKLEKYIKVYNMDIKNVFNNFAANSYDIVSINPPYFENCKINNLRNKSVARHNITINFDEILTSVSYLLNNKGHFYMINRTENFFEIIEKLKNKNLIPKRVSFVYPFKNKRSKLFLIECIKNGKIGLVVDKPIIIYDDNKNYSLELLEMFGDNNDTK